MHIVLIYSKYSPVAADCNVGFFQLLLSEGAKIFFSIELLVFYFRFIEFFSYTVTPFFVGVSNESELHHRGQECSDAVMLKHERCPFLLEITIFKVCPHVDKSVFVACNVNFGSNLFVCVYLRCG